MAGHLVTELYLHGGAPKGNIGITYLSILFVAYQFCIIFINIFTRRNCGEKISKIELKNSD